MKLLYLSNTRFPSERAHAIQIAHTCQAFSNQGVDVTLITNNRDTSPVADWIGFSPKFEHLRVRYGLIFVPYSRLFFLLNDIFFLLFVLARLGSRKFDYLYVRDEWLAWCISLFVKTPQLIWESHEAKYNFAARRILKKGIPCVCISEGVRDYYIEQAVPVTQLLVAHDAIDDSFFDVSISKNEVQQQLGLSGRGHIAMYIGGLEQWKGVETFFAASELCPEVTFIAIGGTPNQVLKFRQQYPRVVFLGQLPYRQLPDIQQGADILVIPNSSKSFLAARYTSPLKLFSYMASGIPITASEIPSLTVILNSDAGFFFTPDDHTSLAKAINHVLAHPIEAAAKAGRARLIASGHTWSKRALKIKQFIVQARVL